MKNDAYIIFHFFSKRRMYLGTQNLALKNGTHFWTGDFHKATQFSLEEAETIQKNWGECHKTSYCLIEIIMVMDS